MTSEFAPAGTSGGSAIIFTFAWKCRLTLDYVYAQSKSAALSRATVTMLLLASLQWLIANG